MKQKFQKVLRLVVQRYEGKTAVEYHRDGITVVREKPGRWFWLNGEGKRGPFSSRNTVHEALSWHLDLRPIQFCHSGKLSITQTCKQSGCRKGRSGAYGYCGEHATNLHRRGHPILAIAYGLLDRPDIKEIAADFYGGLSVKQLARRYDVGLRPMFSLTFGYLLFGGRIA